MKKYRICRRYSPLSGTWYVIQKKGLLFGWHTLNINFDELSMANQYLEFIKEGKRNDDICETPLIWNENKGEFVETYPCKTNLIKIKVK